MLWPFLFFRSCVALVRLPLLRSSFEFRKGKRQVFVNIPGDDEEDAPDRESNDEGGAENLRLSKLCGVMICRYFGIETDRFVISPGSNPSF
jgi:hypothetical protein